MAEQDARTQTPTQGMKPSGGSQSGASDAERDHNPKHDPSAAGADAYNSGNKTGNPVQSGTPATGENGPGVNADKPVPRHDDT